jgi:hypothetical protein
MHSMSRIGQVCCGLSDMSGRLGPSLYLIATNYKHCWATLMLHSNKGTATFLSSTEGVTQGDLLSMFAYSIGVLPLIRLLKDQFTRVKQPWYADNAGAGGKVSDIRSFFRKLQEIGPNFGYFPEPSKSTLIVPQQSRSQRIP